MDWLQSFPLSSYKRIWSIISFPLQNHEKECSKYKTCVNFVYVFTKPNVNSTGWLLFDVCLVINALIQLTFNSGLSFCFLFRSQIPLLKYTGQWSRRIQFTPGDCCLRFSWNYWSIHGGRVSLNFDSYDKFKDNEINFQFYYFRVLSCCNSEPQLSFSNYLQVFFF